MLHHLQHVRAAAAVSHLMLGVGGGCGEGYDLLWYKTDLPGVCQISTNWLSNIPKNSEVKEAESLFWIRVFELISCCQPHCVGHEMSQVLPLPILREVKVGFAQEICRDTRRSNH